MKKFYTGLDIVMLIILIISITAFVTSAIVGSGFYYVITFSLVTLIVINIWILIIVYRTCYYVLSVSEDLGLVPEVTYEFFTRKKLGQ